MKCPICNELELIGAEMACLNCKMTGREMEFWLTNPARNNVLGRIRELPNVQTAMLYPMGDGRWLLAVFLKDGRLVTPLALASVDSEEGVLLAAMIPPVGEQWKVLFTRPSENQGDEGWMGNGSEILEGAFADDGLVEAIASLG